LDRKNGPVYTFFFFVPDPLVPIDEDLDIDGKDVITSFAWHPTEENCLVACRKDGRLAEVHVMERIAPSWSSQHFLMWPQNGTLRYVYVHLLKKHVHMN
jgi:hypothetical protein